MSDILKLKKKCVVCKVATMLNVFLDQKIYDTQ